MVYVGVTGDQHNLMSVITGKSPVASGQSINPSGSGSNNAISASTPTLEQPTSGNPNVQGGTPVGNGEEAV